MSFMLTPLMLLTPIIINLINRTAIYYPLQTLKTFMVMTRINNLKNIKMKVMPYTAL